MKTMSELTGDEIRKHLGAISTGIKVQMPDDARFLVMLLLDDGSISYVSNFTPRGEADALIQYGEAFVRLGKKKLREGN